jgi:hypothetical protein
VTFAVLGFVALGCGGGTSGGTSGNTTGAGQAPNNASDQAPSGSGDQAPNTSSDQAPSTASDSPPASSQDPAGTGDSLSALCHRFCEEIGNAAQRCSDDIEITGCNTANACKVPPGAIPCANEIGDLLDCAIDNLKSVCGGNSGPGNNTGGTSGNPPLRDQPNTSPCEDISKRFLACADAHGLGDDNNNTGDMPRGCYPGGGCQMCANDCQKCTCDANGDIEKSQKCVTDGKCPATP